MRYTFRDVNNEFENTFNVLIKTFECEIKDMIVINIFNYDLKQFFFTLLRELNRKKLL